MATGEELLNEILDTRKLLTEQFRRELVGPGSEPLCLDDEHELIQTKPEKRYCIGILYPQESQIQVENDETTGDAEEELEEEHVEKKEKEVIENKKSYFDGEENLDEEVSLSTQNKPSSMGITFLLDGKQDRLKIHVKFATYRKAKLSDCEIKLPEKVYIPAKFGDIFVIDEEKHTVKITQQIKSHQITEVYRNEDIEDISFQEYAYKLVKLLEQGTVREPHEFEYEIVWKDKEYVESAERLGETPAKITALRHQIKENVFSYTVMLVNDETYSKAASQRMILQPEIRIESEENNIRFVDYSKINTITDGNSEEAAIALEYRNKKSYASGLGTATKWEVDENGTGYIANDFYPIYEVPSMDFEVDSKYNVSKNTLSMRFLSDLDSDVEKDEKVVLLRQFVEAYGTWISEQEFLRQSLEEEYIYQADKHIENCTFSLERMRRGIDYLENNDVAWNAFQLANRAMYMQRVHIMKQGAMSERYTAIYADNEELEEWFDELNYKDEPDNCFWRPFQLAFILLNIVSISNDDIQNVERDLVDLIWFPTGGGKTEAYLGLTAYTIFYRRMVYKDNCDGTTVMMRYTLRLLTAQQFTRAATLICACEKIRTDCLSRRPKYKKYQINGKEISIGLWIGGAHVPNTLEKAKEHISKFDGVTFQSINDVKVNHNKFQVLKCPWCGSQMTKDKCDGKLKGDWGYKIGKNGKSFYLNCPSDFCDFHAKLPIQIIDDELYKEPPTLLFATVDKFAMLPWRKEVGNFFGYDSENRAPELIIQDELHLISGPLGTMVGLYETAIDYMCQNKGAKPKIIASTATICRAKEQCSALYNREVYQFPSPGINEDDSFFAKAADVSQKPGRLYIGMMPSGKTKAMMETRIMAAVLQLVKGLDVSDECKDNFWTLTAYFNSLKELGKCSSIVDDDVKDYIRRLARRTPNGPATRGIGRADELTSRNSTTELNDTLDKLEKVHYSSDNDKNKVFASNILLASNMISVGIDVSRLNIMLMVGQPKLTSEYIQASSRVGRKFPGIVLTQYDASRSRDRSHYEQFKQYHSSFYKYVEPTCVTPFSEPARDRALHAVAISMIRHIEGLQDDDAISAFDRTSFKDDLKDITAFIEERVEKINERLPYEIKSDADDVEKELEDIYEKIELLADRANHEKLNYGRKYMVNSPDEGEYRVLKTFDSFDKNDLVFDTLTSLRDVTPGINGSIIVFGEEDNV